jgi:hypothetical protein
MLVAQESYANISSLGENNLSFIETSALDASNVELAFQNILTGTPNSVYIQDTWQWARVAGT